MPSLKFVNLFIAAAVGGYSAYLVGAPLPFLLGGVVGAAGYVWIYERRGALLGKPHKSFRLCGIAVTGAIIGVSVSPDLLQILPAFWVSALAILPFILIAHAGGYSIMRRVGGYRPVDAYYASMPGGLVEAVLLGEKAGASVPLLTVQHFIRVLSIVVSVPLIFFLATGQIVGSAGGETIGGSLEIAGGWIDIASVLAIALVGLGIGRLSHMPAHQLMGPLLLAAGLAVSGSLALAVPAWLLHLAQFLVGATLGAQFSGIDRRLLLRGLAMGVLSVGYMLLVGLAFALALAPWVPVETPAMFISFAAGGVTEMSLIALSLQLSPVIVALHHLVRIFLTVWVASGIAKWRPAWVAGETMAKVTHPK